MSQIITEFGKKGCFLSFVERKETEDDKKRVLVKVPNFHELHRSSCIWHVHIICRGPWCLLRLTSMAMCTALTHQMLRHSSWEANSLRVWEGPVKTMLTVLAGEPQELDSNVYSPSHGLQVLQSTFTCASMESSMDCSMNVCSGAVLSLL